MKTIQIPTYNSPFTVVINNNVYRYNAGETKEVPDEVAEAIENALKLTPKQRKFVGNKVDLKIDAGNRTVECDVPIGDLLLRLEQEGYECVNIQFSMYGNPVVHHKISGSLPELLRVHYMYLIATGDTPSISFDNVSIKKDGTLSFMHESTVVGG